MTGSRRLLPGRVVAVVVVLALVGVGCRVGGPGNPGAGPTTTVSESTSTTGTTTTTVAGARVGQAALARARWVTYGPDGLRTDDGSLLWEPEVILGAAFVARDGEGGVAYVDARGLWWIAPGAERPKLVADYEALLPSGELIEVIPTSSGPVARIGYVGDSGYVNLSTGQLVTEAPPGRVRDDGSWVAANGLLVRILGPEVVWDPEEGVSSPTEVIEPARLTVERDGEVRVDAAVGTIREPFVRVHDFDGRTVIVSRYPWEPANPAETFFVIDLGCGDCLHTFQAGATSAALVGSDTQWSGPIEQPPDLSVLERGDHP